MPSAADPAKLGQIVEDLYAKKRWLDRVIASLESAVASPDYRLIAALTEAFERDEKRAAKVELPQFQHVRIEKLAGEVTRRRNSLGVVNSTVRRAQRNAAVVTSSREKKQSAGTEQTALSA